MLHHSSTGPAVFFTFTNKPLLSCLCSGITWVLVYRTEKYKRLKAEVEKQSKKRKWFILEPRLVLLLNVCLCTV